MLHIMVLKVLYKIWDTWIVLLSTERYQCNFKKQNTIKKRERQCWERKNNKSACIEILSLLCPLSL